jgi:hypothetical protein
VLGSSPATPTKENEMTVNTTIIDRVKDGMHEAARLYGWVDNVWGTTEHVDFQVKRGLDGNLFPFPVFYAIRTGKIDPEDPQTPKFKVLRFFLKKDLTEGTLQEYLKGIANLDHWRNSNHADAMAVVMREF